MRSEVIHCREPRGPTQGVPGRVVGKDLKKWARHAYASHGEAMSVASGGSTFQNIPRDLGRGLGMWDQDLGGNM